MSAGFQATNMHAQTKLNLFKMYFKNIIIKKHDLLIVSIGNEHRKEWVSYALLVALSTTFTAMHFLLAQ